MKISFRALAVALVTCSLSVVLLPAHANARTHHATAHTKHATVCSHFVGKHGHRHLVHTACKKATAGSHGMTLREAQTHLASLGYYTGKIDGKMGKQTKAAIKAFQREHGLKPDGVLGPKTRLALIASDRTKSMDNIPAPVVATPGPDFYAKHPDYYGHYDSQYGDPMQLARENPVLLTQGVPSRFAQIAMTEMPSGNLKKYNVTVNGQPVLLIDNQPSVIGVSKTFNLGPEDAIIFSTFNPEDPVCSFKHFLMTLHEGTNQLLPIENCTRGYQASVKDNGLFIVFPEGDDGRLVGATWRYDGGNLTRL